MNIKSMKIYFFAVFAILVQGCNEKRAEFPASTKPTDPALQAFIDGVKRDLVYVEGGEFLMGDFGSQYGSERLPYDSDADSSPLHKVRLSSFSADKFKVTNERYQFFLAYNNKTLREDGGANKKKWNGLNAIPNVPAHIDWYEAEDYCLWLAKVAQLPFALPTEAQWEYIARSRGQFLMVATDEGDYKTESHESVAGSYSPAGINISSGGNRLAFAKEKGLKTGRYTPLPVDMFPPNPLGLYSMSDSGYEWVQDWYDPEYYNHSPYQDPRGPDHPIFKNPLGHATKVARGQDYANPQWGGGVNVFRNSADPLGRIHEDGTVFVGNKTMRCVVNSPEPVSLGATSG